mgnify:CR=1 FL=1
MISRIVKIREDNNLSQEKFAEKLGLSRNFINQVENGKKNVSNRTISDICRLFNVNRKWLETGSGDPYVDPEEKFVSYISEITDSDDDFIKDFISVYMELDETSKLALRKIADGMAKKRKERDL